MDKPIPTKKKVNTHIAFLSDKPKGDLEKIDKWAKINNVRINQGKWSNKELWFDLPDIFINFVIEIMDKRVAS